MTPFIQSLISNQAQRVDRIPIRDAVKPVNPLIPEPIPRHTPISQKDQAHLIPPEIISNMNPPIQSKETQQIIIIIIINP
jgi:hypothetical protein